MAKQLMSIGGHLKNLIYEDSTEYPIVLTDENGDGSAFNGKTLVGNASGQFVPSTVTGYITGPGSSTDNTVVRFDGITGTVIQGSGVAIDDLDNVDIPGQLTMGSSNIVVTTVAGLPRPRVHRSGRCQHEPGARVEWRCMGAYVRCWRWWHHGGTWVHRQRSASF
jgi:hypothetical protein